LKTKPKSKKAGNRRFLLLEVVTIIVAFVAGGIVAPIVGSYVSSSLNPKPEVEILRDKTFIVPVMGTNQVLILTNVKNTGSAPEQGVIVQFEVNSPLTFINITNGSPVALGTVSDVPVGNIPSGQTLMVEQLASNPMVTQLQHGSFQVTIEVYGNTKSWGSESFSQSW
jgi:hypothetical protein